MLIFVILFNIVVYPNLNIYEKALELNHLIDSLKYNVYC